MNFALRQYIEDNCNLHGKPVYNPLIWKASEEDGGPNQHKVDINAKNDNAIFIIVHQMAYSLPTGAPSHFTDVRFPLTPFLNFTNATVFDNIVPFLYIVKGNRLKITSTAGATAPLFSLCYQTVTQIKKDE